MNLNLDAQDLVNEKIALDFYLDSLHIDKSRVYYNGVISLGDAPVDMIHTFTKYYDCIKRTSSIDKDKFAVIFDKIMYDSGINLSVDTNNKHDLSLPINAPLIDKSQYKYKKLRGGVVGISRNLIDKMIGESYFLDIYKNFSIDSHNFVMISLTKSDKEYCIEYYFRFDNNNRLIDYYEGGWVD
jgi:hypothetical protein